MSDSPLSMNLYAEDWLKRPLIKVSEFIKDGTHGTHERVNIGVPLLSAKNITSYGSITIDEEDSRISNDDYQKIHSKYEIQKNDLLITVVGTLGRRALADGVHKFSIQRSVGVVRCDTTKIFPEFLYHFTGSDYFQNQLTLRSNATAQAGVYLGELAKIDIAIPPLPEQQKIATILTSVDTVIEKTRAQIDKLKHLKTGMMQELLTQGIGHTEFKNTPVGRIPKAWEIQNINGLVTKVGSGVTPRGGSAAYVSSGVPLIRSQNVYSDGLRLEDVAYITAEQHKKMANSQLKPNDVLLNITGASIGRCHYLPSDFKEGNVNQHVCIIRPKQSVINSAFLAYLLNSELGQRQIMSLQAGGNREGINFQQIREISFAIPTLPEQQKIVNVLQSIDTKIIAANQKFNSVEQTKKALMQDLLTGNVRI